ncbi:hypothetical protein CY0110_17797 [Crocosphaera chwakensis CCY0110]|uniref:Uncharacterized protein n=1 Tax=Crocosphaera chwakensis CCY0110 TaxID=391612 RepID=A3IIP1_9CHRO|nr:hypothetical protein CY0110_17797 [Crocosphaera chwakensis CCY0110]
MYNLIAFNSTTVSLGTYVKCKVAKSG